MKRDKRLLHFIDTGGPGGAETVFARLAVGLDSCGYKAVTVVSRDDWLAKELRKHDLEPLILSPKLGRISYLRRIVDIIREERIDAVVSHLLGASLYASLAATYLKVPQVAVFHGQKDIESSRQNKLKGRLLSMPEGASVFVSSSLMRDLRPALGISPARCKIIPNGIDATAFADRTSRLKERLSVSEDTLLIGSVGNVREPKAYDILLRAASKVSQRNINVAFVVAGEGHPQLSEELDVLHNELELGDRFRFLGLVDDIPEYLAGLDLFVLPSRQEGFSIACVEAMATGLPVIATRSGGPEEIIEHEDSGLLVPADDPDALATAIFDLVKNKLRCQQFATKAKSRAATKFSLERCIDEYASLVDSFL